MTTIAKAKAEILDRIPADQREEYLRLQAQIDSNDRLSKSIQRENAALRDRIGAITSAAVKAATTDRDLAVLRHSSTAAYQRFLEVVRAIHPRLQGPMNYTVDDAPKGTAPFLGIEVNLYTGINLPSTLSNETATTAATDLAAALVEFADRFVGDDVPDFGNNAGRIFSQMLTGADSRYKGMSLMFTPTGGEATLFIVDWDGDREPIHGTLVEVLATAIRQSMEWASEDDGDDD